MYIFFGKIHFIYLKARVRKLETERDQLPSRNQNLFSLSTNVKGPRNSDHLLLLTQAHFHGWVWMWNSQDIKAYPYANNSIKATKFATMPAPKIHLLCNSKSYIQSLLMHCQFLCIYVCVCLYICVCMFI